jgi:hypothetical protein
MQKKKAANRPLKYAQPTIIVTVRVPSSEVLAFKKMVKRWLKKFER